MLVDVIQDKQKKIEACYDGGLPTLNSPDLIQKDSHFFRCPDQLIYATTFRNIVKFEKTFSKYYFQERK